jgi:hypothetical protein
MVLHARLAVAQIKERQRREVAERRTRSGHPGYRGPPALSTRKGASMTGWWQSSELDHGDQRAGRRPRPWEHIRTDPVILLDAWDDLADLGSNARPHVKEQVTQAQQLVNDVLHAIGDAAGDRGRAVSPVARGLVVLLAREIVAYKQGARPPRIRRVPSRRAWRAAAVAGPRQI